MLYVYNRYRSDGLVSIWPVLWAYSDFVNEKRTVKSVLFKQVVNTSPATPCQNYHPNQGKKNTYSIHVLFSITCFWFNTQENCLKRRFFYSIANQKTMKLNVNEFNFEHKTTKF